MPRRMRKASVIGSEAPHLVQRMPEGGGPEEHHMLVEFRGSRMGGDAESERQRGREPGRQRAREPGSQGAGERGSQGA